MARSALASNGRAKWQKQTWLGRWQDQQNALICRSFSTKPTKTPELNAVRIKLDISDCTFLAAHSGMMK
jgi:hypothetical protein